MAWEEWIQDVAGSVIKDASEARFQLPYQVQKLKIQALGTDGEIFQEGQAQGLQQGIPKSYLILGAIVIGAVVLLRD